MYFILQFETGMVSLTIGFKTQNKNINRYRSLKRTREILFLSFTIYKLRKLFDTNDRNLLSHCDLL